MHVYFIQSGYDKKPPIKIGVAKSIDRRLRTLQTANPEKLTLIASIKCESRGEAFNIESYLHKELNNRKIRGEWFATCMRRVDKIMKKWYTDKDFDFGTYCEERIENELDMKMLSNDTYT
tara:strand:+ start:3024 stop:3383 length:360 start_codon:yes stop_codon:yes gene_type:complete